MKAQRFSPPVAPRAVALAGVLALQAAAPGAQAMTYTWNGHGFNTG